jgi:hypothetical protein
MTNSNTIIDSAIHFAFATANLDAFMKQLNNMNIAFESGDDGYLVDDIKNAEKKKTKLIIQVVF